jgi:hypothetical protein
MIIISDTSPISNLLVINQINLLQEIFEAVILPQAVMLELRASKSFNINNFLASDWVKIEKLNDQILYNHLLQELDPGEAEAIALAKELNFNLLIDEKKGRKIAQDLGIKITGVVGVLITAKDLGLIPEIKPMLDDLEHKAGFWMSDSFRNYALMLANELP